MITIVIPAHNAASTIEATIKSTAPDGALVAEILLVDDRSDDGTAQIASAAAAAASIPLRIVSGSFGGAGAARNAGMAAATGRYIFFLDADDELFPGALGLLLEALAREPQAGVAVGATMRRTAGRADKMKVPSGYTSDRQSNARRYLLNELLPIAMGSALVRADAVRDLRFPTAIGLDEDSCYWAVVLSRTDVVTIADPVMRYNLDERRMAERFVAYPRAAFLGIARAFRALSAYGIEREVLRWRAAWVALRIARLLIMHRRYHEARDMLRVAQAHGSFRSGWKSVQYSARIGVGLAAQRLGLLMPGASSRPGGTGRKPRRTLVLTTDPACPPVSGADLRNHQNARAATQFGPVMLVSVRPLPVAAPAGGAIASTALTRAGEPRSQPLARRRTVAEIRIPRHSVRRLLLMAREFDADTIVVEGIALAALLPYLRPLARTLVLDMHNIESSLFAQTSRTTVAERFLPAGWRRRERIERLERRALSWVDRAWVCSDADRERLRLLSGSQVPIDVVPNGIPRPETMPSSLDPLPDGENGWPVMLFAGHLGYPPNVEAAERLARAILPMVRATFPSASLLLAGRHPAPQLRALARLPGVELIEAPVDITAVLRRGHVGVVPLSAGGGTRIKIVEATAWGLPVVASPIAAEGQDLVDGEEILLAETDAEIAQAVVALCENRERLDLLRGQAFAKVRLLYGPQAIDLAVRRGFGLNDEPRPRAAPQEKC